MSPSLSLVSVIDRNTLFRPYLYAHTPAVLTCVLFVVLFSFSADAASGAFTEINTSSSDIWTILSPSERVKAAICLVDIEGEADYPSGEKHLYYSVGTGGPSQFTEVVWWSPMGVVCAERDFYSGLVFVSESAQRTIDSVYTMITGKRSSCRNHCNEKVLTFTSGDGTSPFEIIIRAYDDGFAFRYRFPDDGTGSALTVTSEKTGFRPPDDSRMWMLAYNTTGDMYAPAYEDIWYRNLSVGDAVGETAKPSDGTWCMPALYQTPEGVWALIWETDVTPDYCASRLSNTAYSHIYRIAFPNENEVQGNGSAVPSSTLPWVTPWRCIITGMSCGTILESTLSTDCATPSTIADPSWIRPGRSSWSWWSDENSPKNYTALTSFIDLAADMNWEYSLVDAKWDSLTGGTWQQLIEYAGSKNVGLNFWYNAGGDINTITGVTPRDRLNEPGRRNDEFTMLHDAGAKGIKVDFWLSDKQDIIRYYWDVFADAAKHNLIVNIHGSTIPRGWQRTFPNLVTAEANRGAENYIWFEDDPARFPWQNTVLPFTRNAVASMDWTPVTFTNNTHAHLTTYAHELALSVVFESGIQHFADRVSGYSTATITEGAREFLKAVPTAWDDTKYLSGYPGSYLVLARRKGYDWYVAGIAGDTARNVEVNLSFLQESPAVYDMTLITDGTDGRSFSERSDSVSRSEAVQVEIPQYGGLVARLINLNPIINRAGSIVARHRSLSRGSMVKIQTAAPGPLTVPIDFRDKQVRLSCYSLNGRLVGTCLLTASGTVDVSSYLHLPVGIYFVRWKAGERVR